MEMCEDRKNFNFPLFFSFFFLFFFNLKVEKWRDERSEFVQIYSYTLLKNDAQLKKNDKQPKK